MNEEEKPDSAETTLNDKVGKQSPAFVRSLHQQGGEVQVVVRATLRANLEDVPRAESARGKSWKR
ncbi:hypothetical protein N7457_003437 [Penicillium paradoxum]|uniref:uncharacterized protein n=1 Tax=Penicillium paradoxum TaxID=176176 RepID=UPI0025487DFA|nr:uncharacterized protein N7457_003437 [Penicillium paradoxum]KAJ5788447.1 hypothetical protein N7457_003437 [Penicillium paradoxum]